MVEFFQSACIPINETCYFHADYLSLQQLSTVLRFDNICCVIKGCHDFKYDFHAILTVLIYPMVLSLSSKLNHYYFCRTLFKPQKYEIQIVCRALSILAKEFNFIQNELYKSSNFIHPRNQKIFYYDNMNYYFEVEEESGLRYYGIFTCFCSPSQYILYVLFQI